MVNPKTQRPLSNIRARNDFIKPTMPGPPEKGPSSSRSNSFDEECFRGPRPQSLSDKSPSRATNAQNHDRTILPGRPPTGQNRVHEDNRRNELLDSFDFTEESEVIPRSNIQAMRGSIVKRNPLASITKGPRGPNVR